MFDKLDNLEGRAIGDFLNGDYGPRDLPASMPVRPIPSSAKVVAYDLLNAENSTVGERKLFALVDTVVCVLAHGDQYGNEETARLALETVVGSAVALAAVRTLTGQDR